MPLSTGAVHPNVQLMTELAETEILHATAA
jgi:hypothetical protein